MSEPIDQNLILTSYDAVATFFGVSRDTVRQAWKSRGMPCEPGGGGQDGMYDVRAISQWLAARLRNAGAWSEPADHQDYGDVGKAEYERRTAQHDRLQSLFVASDWRAAIHFCVTEYWLCHGRVDLEDIVSKIWLANPAYGANEFDEWCNPLNSGYSAVRIKGTRVFLHAGLDSDFAAALAKLVNSGLIHVERGEHNTKPGICGSFLDLPVCEDLDSGSKTNTVFPAVFVSKPDDAVPMTLETVFKPRLKMTQRSWLFRREQIRSSLDDWEGVGFSTSAERRRWIEELSSRVAKIKP